MGMYDYLKININKLPLTNAEKLLIGENHLWQTKDFECILSTAEINDEGKIRFLTFEYEWDENAPDVLFHITGKKGSLVRKGEQWIDIEKHGFIYFYDIIDGWCYQFMAKFTDGVLVNIERVEYKEF